MSEYDTDHEPEHDTTDSDTREITEGRGQGDGRWLEHQLVRALRRWGYRADDRQTAYGLEVDVVARREEKENNPTDWIVAECKDWNERPITPDVLHRLCMLAFACRATPILCHTSTLTERARRLAWQWEVRVLTLDDLHRGELPAPHITWGPVDLHIDSRQFTGRQTREGLPTMFRKEPNKHFTYVPGYEAEGSSHEYRPIEDDQLLDDLTPPHEGDE